MKEHLLKFNPQAKPYYDLRDQIEFHEKNRETYISLLEWYNTNNLHYLQKNLELAAHREAREWEKLHKIQEDLLQTHRRLQLLKKSLKSRINPLNWFSESQKKLRQEIKILSSKRDDDEKVIDKTKDQLKDLKAATLDRQKDADKYRDFDLERVEDTISKTALKVSQLRKELEKLERLKHKIDLALDPVLRKLQRQEKEVELLSLELREAEDYDRELSNAGNSYERAMIHEKCGERLGDPSPRKVINRNKRKLLGLERGIEKLKSRAREIGTQAARIITSVILDGNNLCFENDKFIGLIPLQKLIAKLNNRYKTIVVFDASILPLSKLHKNSLINMFTEGVMVHVVASAQDADRTILEVASEDSERFVISNDRFIDFFDQKAVVEKRILKHNIVDKVIMVHDLDINTSYATVG